eukprot:6701499-Alexandrium_andersonii.AAC.1
MTDHGAKSPRGSSPVGGSFGTPPQGLLLPPSPVPVGPLAGCGGEPGGTREAVSYTHLTLPTICSV